MDRVKKLVGRLNLSRGVASPPPVMAAEDTASPEPVDRPSTDHDPPNGCSTTGTKSAAAAKSSSTVDTSAGSVTASPPVAAQVEERSAVESSVNASKKETPTNKSSSPVETSAGNSPASPPVAAQKESSAVESAGKAKSSENSATNKSSSSVETSAGNAPASPPVTAQASSAAKSSAKAKCSKKETAAKPYERETAAVAPKARATRRLMREYQDMVRSGEFICNLVEDNLFEWDVELTDVDSDSALYHDMVSASVDGISLHFSFPPNYPFAPPFLRVQRPFITGGYVMDGGAICMELLTSEGWSGVYTAEGVVRQFAASLVAGKARLVSKPRVAYTHENAKQAFKRIVKIHEVRGWYTPPKEKG